MLQKPPPMIKSLSVENKRTQGNVDFSPLIDYFAMEYTVPFHPHGNIFRGYLSAGEAPKNIFYDLQQKFPPWAKASE